MSFLRPLQDPTILLNQPDLLENALSTDDISLIQQIYHCLLLGLSLFIAFYGYRFFRVSIMLQGAIIGGFLGYFIGGLIVSNTKDPTTKELVPDFFALGLGLLTAGVAWCFRHAMLFVFGVAFGIQTATVVDALILRYMRIRDPRKVGYLVLLGFAFVFGALSSCATRAWHIILTSFVGCFWAIQAVGYFEGSFPSVFDLFNTKGNQITMSYFGYIVGWIISSFIAVYVQYHFTAKHVDHHKHQQEDDEDEDEEDGKKYHHSFYHKLRGD